MPLVTRAVQTVGKRLPKVISPRGHAIFDYVQIGIFTALGAIFWKSNRRASVAALCCAAAEATNALLTDYPGGRAKVFSFETHGRIDAAMAGAIAGLPNILGFGSEPQARLFRIRGAVTAGVTALTRFREKERHEREHQAA
jgi:hypothetical protein